MKREPKHPGETLREDLDAAGLSAAEMARRINVPVNRITQILNGQRNVTADTALRLGRYFGTSGEFWLNLQRLHELSLAELEHGDEIGRLPSHKDYDRSAPAAVPRVLFGEDNEGQQTVKRRSTTPGYVNRNGQVNLGRTNPPRKGTDHNQYIYVMHCPGCKLNYGANGSDIHQRKCPDHQDGARGSELTEHEMSLRPARQQQEGERGHDHLKKEYDVKNQELPYDMGNAGDLLKHGVLAEFVRWRCNLGSPIRFFIDLFGGEPEGHAVPEVRRRVQALPPDVALHRVQADTGRGIYYGSGLVARRADKIYGKGETSVLIDDAVQARRERLSNHPDLTLLRDEFPICYPAGGDNYDGYQAFATLAGDQRGRLNENDLVLIDPFAEFLRDYAKTVVPQIAKLAERAWVLLFALNLDPCNSVGQQFERLLENHLRGAWRMTCPPLPIGTGVRGESKFHAELVLAGPSLLETNIWQNTDLYKLRKNLDPFAQHLASVLDLAAPRDVD